MVMLDQSGNYLKVEDVKDGELVTFKDGGTWTESSKYNYDDGNPKQDFVMTVEHNGAEYKLRVGKFSRDELVPAYGNDTEHWIGKQAMITIETYRSLNKKGIILTPIDKGQADVSSSAGETKEW